MEVLKEELGEVFGADWEEEGGREDMLVRQLGDVRFLRETQEEVKEMASVVRELVAGEKVSLRIQSHFHVCTFTVCLYVGYVGVHTCNGHIYTYTVCSYNYISVYVHTFIGYIHTYTACSYNYCKRIRTHLHWVHSHIHRICTYI